jgi:nucleoside 2-deoxyribosyltransferase
MKVYLAGPIAGKSYEEAMDWRLAAYHYFSGYGITSYSPMRAKDGLKGTKVLSGVDYPEEGPLSSRAMYRRDLHDVRTADVVLVNLTGADRVSIGTMIEIGYAVAQGKYIVVVMESDNIHQHLFITESASLICKTLDAALDWICEVMYLE